MVRPTIVAQPTRCMATRRVPVGPMDDTALGIPFVYPVEADRVAFRKPGNPGRQIDVVGDQNGLAGRQAQHEALVAAAFVVIRQQGADDTVTNDLDAAALCAECVGDRVVRLRLAASAARSGGIGRRTGADEWQLEAGGIPAAHKGGHQCEQQDLFFHVLRFARVPACRSLGDRFVISLK
jgi:hypothetical protein